MPDNTSPGEDEDPASNGRVTASEKVLATLAIIPFFASYGLSSSVSINGVVERSFFDPIAASCGALGLLAALVVSASHSHRSLAQRLALADIGAMVSAYHLVHGLGLLA